MVKNKELIPLGTEDLKKKIDEIKFDMIKTNAQVKRGTTVKNPHQIKNMKKTIAKIKTILSQRGEA